MKEQLSKESLLANYHYHNALYIKYLESASYHSKEMSEIMDKVNITKMENKNEIKSG